MFRIQWPSQLLRYKSNRQQKQTVISLTLHEGGITLELLRTSPLHLQEHRTSWPGTWISVPPNVVVTCCCSLSSLLHPHEDCFRVVSPPACVLTEPDIVLKKFAVERSRQTFNSCALCIPSSPLIKRPSPGHPIYPKTIRQIVLIVFYVCVGMNVLFRNWKLYEICIKEC